MRPHAEGDDLGIVQTVRTRPNVLSFEAMIPFGSDAISSSGRLAAPQRLRAQYRTWPNIDSTLHSVG